MKTISTICFGLAIFLGVAGLIYLFTAHEYAGATELLVAAITFGFLGLVTRAADRRAPPEAAEEEELHIASTIWPFGFALAGVVVGIGLIVSPWILLLGAAGCAVCAAGWLREVARSHAGP
jgi:Cytochrome c oxidase subunit IV